MSGTGTLQSLLIFHCTLNIIIQSEEAEDIWKHFLSRHFQFKFNSKTNHHDDDPDSLTYYLKTLKVWSGKNRRTGSKDEDDNDNESIDSMPSLYVNTSNSIFGYKAIHIVYLAPNAYESWRQWNIAKIVYYKGYTFSEIQNMTMNAPCKFCKIFEYEIGLMCMMQ